MIRRLPTVIFLFCLALQWIGCTSMPRYRRGESSPPVKPGGRFVQIGIASYYAEDFHGKLTASGETFNMYELSAAHKTLPLGTVVRVTNLDNGKSVVVPINDRGPFVKNRIIDLSYGAAKVLGMIGPGTARVRVEVLEWGKDK